MGWRPHCSGWHLVSHEIAIRDSLSYSLRSRARPIPTSSARGPSDADRPLVLKVTPVARAVTTTRVCFGLRSVYDSARLYVWRYGYGRCGFCKSNAQVSRRQRMSLWNDRWRRVAERADRWAFHAPRGHPSSQWPRAARQRSARPMLQHRLLGGTWQCLSHESLLMEVLTRAAASLAGCRHAGSRRGSLG